MKKVLHAVAVATVLAAASGVATAGPGCDGKWAADDGLHDEVAPVTKANAPKATTPVASKDTRTATAKAPARTDTAKVVQVR